nr:acylneuraminate cytidylyltransferase family protein [Motiliproteus sediminis]
MTCFYEATTKAMSCVAIIPARGGSKAIPQKNITDLAGKPLLRWTVEAALASQQVDRVIVSTDDPAIAAVARDAGAEVPTLRPAKFADDDTHSIHAVLHMLRWLKSNETNLPERCCMLLPTSPFRTASDIDAGLTLHQQETTTPVIGVTDAKVPIISLRWIEANRLRPIDDFPDLQLQRQDGKPLYRVNGAFYAASSAKLLEQQSFHTPGARPLLMSWASSLDINTPADLALARILAANTDKLQDL